jgi:hypothetical protein
MNFVFLSPHFPPNYYAFATALKGLGVNVLGIADADYDSLSPALKAGLTEYYRVSDMHNYDELVRALGYFTHHYGKLDRLDSHNEYWLETEAHLRTDFNITGIRMDAIDRIKRKSKMKETFRQAGVRTARGGVVNTLEEALAIVKETGYPLVAKPDIGVGAAATYKIHNEAELKNFIASKPPVDYMLEEFVDGQIVTFDGLTDRDGVPVFTNSLLYSRGIMEIVLDDELVYYYTQREIPADVDALGRRLLRAFDVRERFFHFEFFRKTGSDELIALEVNMRPPGGLTTDMFNYACDIDIYYAWACMIAGREFPYVGYTQKYYCCYASRKDNRAFAHSEQEIMEKYGDKFCQTESISGVFSLALGNQGFIFRSPNFDEIVAIANFIQQQ